MTAHRQALAILLALALCAGAATAGTITADLGRKGGTVVLYDATVVETQEGFPTMDSPLIAKRLGVTHHIAYEEIEAIVIKRITQTAIVADVLRWNGRNVYDAKLYNIRRIKGYESPGESGPEIHVDVRQTEELQIDRRRN